MFPSDTNLVEALLRLSMQLTKAEKLLTPTSDRIKVVTDIESGKATIEARLPFTASFTEGGVEPVCSEYVELPGFSAENVQGLPNSATLTAPCATLYAIAVQINSQESTLNNLPTGTGVGLDISFDTFEIIVSASFPIAFDIGAEVSLGAVNYLAQ
jgi:hypothetical protein